MKKTTLLFIIALGFGLSFSSCKKNTEAEPVLGCTDPTSLNYNSLATSDDGSCVIPEQSQKALLLEFTGAWCGSCGGYGGPVFNSLISNNPGKVVPIAVHWDDDMTPEMYINGFYPLLPDGTVSLPHFRIGDVATSNNSQILSICAQTPVVAQTAFIYTNGSGTISVKTRTKFFTAATGNFLLSVYVLENGIEGSSGPYQQSGGGSGYKHNYVLRAASNNQSMGETIITTNATANQTIDKTYNIAYTKLSTSSTISVATVIWKRDGSTYKFINAFIK